MWGLYWNQRKGGTEKALDYLQRSVQKDPEYAPAYAALTMSYSIASLTGVMPPAEANLKWKSAVAKTLELDSNSADAHYSLGGALLNLDWNWRDAERELRRAIQLNANLADAHLVYSNCLMALGRVDEAIAEVQKKVQLDPYSPQGTRFLGQFLIRARRYDEAIERIHKTLARSDLAPLDAGMEHMALGAAYQLKGLYPQAIEELQQAVKINEAEPYGRIVALGGLAHTYATWGRKSDALRELKRLKESPAMPERTYAIALAYAGLGDRDQSFQWLDTAFEGRPNLSLVWIKTDPRMDSLHADPRYGELLRRMGLPE
jgi:tetratricopeptide (TPR) repeat protein